MPPPPIQPADDTIVAPATPPGRAAIAVVRVTGPRAGEIARRICGRSVGDEDSPTRVARLARIVGRDGVVIDRALVTRFAAPRSYTGEELVEFSVHGAPPVVDELVAACVEAGARPAEPGEFTLRALRAGKLDLSQAEAVRDLVDASTIEQARVAARQLSGEVRDAFVPLANEVVDLLADLEGGLEFSDDESALALPGATLAARARAIEARIDELVRTSESARRVREGARVVLHGPPNAGKSSLFNALLGEQRAIVTGEPGTTRDLVEETTVIEGLPVVLVDAAGVGEARGEAEAEGMRRARVAASGAHLVLDVYDPGTSRAAPADPSTDSPGSRLVVATHADVRGSVRPGDGTFAVSVVTGEGLDELRREIARRLRAPGSRPLESVALATERHRAAALTARDALARGREILGLEGEAELAAVELREAVASLHSILGAVGPEEILGSVFARFCIGK